MKLEIGKKYRTRDGRVAEVIRRAGGGTWPFLGVVDRLGRYYMEDGSWGTPGTEEELDLIEEIPESRILNAESTILEQERQIARYQTTLEDQQRRIVEYTQIFDWLNLQDIGRELDLTLGATISKETLPGIRRLKARVADLTDRCVELERVSHESGCRNIYLSLALEKANAGLIEKDDRIAELNADTSRLEAARGVDATRLHFVTLEWEAAEARVGGLLRQVESQNEYIVRRDGIIEHLEACIQRLRDPNRGNYGMVDTAYKFSQP